MMKIIFSLTLICLAVIGAESRQSETKGGCTFSISGMWKSESIPGLSPVFLHFLPNGWVQLVEHPGEDALPQEFEIVTEMKYQLDKPDNPERIEFIARRGIGVFRPGTSSMDLTDVSDDSFTLTDSESGRQTQWERTETHRYFLAFVAQRKFPQQGSYLFATWSALDGRGIAVESLGIQLAKDAAGKTVPRFGPIPDEVSNQPTEEGDKNVVLRLELTESDFARTHKFYQVWDNYVKNHALPSADPYQNALEFLIATAESLNQCSEKVKLQKLTSVEREEIISKQKISQYLLEYISVMRKKNDELHVTEGSIPMNWRPFL
jgi:hypothetical protein